MIGLYNAECLSVLRDLASGSVDAIICDPPYGTAGGMGKNEKRYSKIASVEWDVKLDLKLVLNECNRVLRTNGPLILFAQEPYTSELITQAHQNIPFSYRLLWLKDHFSNSLLVNKAPVSYFEDICVFFKKYDTLAGNPIRFYSLKIMEVVGKKLKEINADLGHRKAEHFFYVDSTQFKLCTKIVYEELVLKYNLDTYEWFISYEDLNKEDINFRNKSPKIFNLYKDSKFKSNVLQYKKDYSGFHPTQKPVKLMEDIIKTYTNEGQTVLDFTMGSGSTGVACKNLNRKFIGIELDETYFNIAKNRIMGAQE